MNRNPCWSAKRLKGSGPHRAAPTPAVIGPVTRPVTRPNLAGRHGKWAAACLMLMVVFFFSPPFPFAVNFPAANLAAVNLAVVDFSLGFSSAKAAFLEQCPKDRQLCLQADKSGGINLKTGVAHLLGNVKGLMRSRQLEFEGESLKAYRGGGKEWVRLVIEGKVRIRQPGRLSKSDRSVLEKGRIRLSGSVTIAQGDITIQCQEALLESNPDRTVVRGGPNAPLRIVLKRRLVASPRGSSSQPVETVVTAAKAELEEKGQRVRLSGNVRILQSDNGLEIKAERVTLWFGSGRALRSFQAEGKVTITQPGRVISADRASSKDNMRTIILSGKANMRQKGQFDLSSETLVVHTDPRRGVIQSANPKKPITLILDFKEDQTRRLTPAEMTTLAQRGVPPLTLEKLGPLLNKTYPTGKALEAEVKGRLTEAESRRYLSLILGTAR